MIKQSRKSFFTRKHMGPGSYPSGTSQDVHGNGGITRDEHAMAIAYSQGKNITAEKGTKEYGYGSADEFLESTNFILSDPQKKILEQARKDNMPIVATIKETPFGRFLMNLEVAKDSLRKSLDDFSETLLYFSDNIVKTIGNYDNTIGAYSIVFGNNQTKDFHGNWFTKDTFLGHNRGNGSVATLNHRMPFFKSGQFAPEVESRLTKMIKRPMTNPVHTTVDAIGVFSTLVCDLSDEYEKMVYDLAKAGKLKWSSGTAPQLYDALPSGELKMFVIAEQALTPIPAEYRMLDHKVMPIKSYLELLKNL